MTNGQIRRGGGHRHLLAIPEELVSVKKATVTYSQLGKVIVEKEFENVREQNPIQVYLTQKETMRFTEGEAIEIQMKIMLDSGDVIVSNIVRVECTKGLSEEVMSA